MRLLQIKKSFLNYFSTGSQMRPENLELIKILMQKEYAHHHTQNNNKSSN